MGAFTFVPVWVIEDAILYLAALLTLIYIIRNERRPDIILVEFASFVVLYAAVYENFATYVAVRMQFYGYGRSLISIFNVPLSVPIFEYLVVYSSLKLLDTMRMPTWCKPFVLGMLAILADFSLDPVAVKQIFQTAEGTMGRWTWLYGPNDVRIFSEPVFNFTGWALICGWGATFLMIGRRLFERSSERKVVGYLYPPIAMLVSLVVVVSPLSNFLLWLGPFFHRGSITEWVMLGFFLLFPAALLLAGWRGRMAGGLSLGQDYPVFLVLGGLPVVNILFAAIGAYWEIIPLQAAALLVTWVLLAAAYVKGRAALRREVVPGRLV